MQRESETGTSNPKKPRPDFRAGVVQRLAKQIDAGRIKDPQKIQRKIGKLQERNKRAARFFRITLCEDQEKAKLLYRKKQT